MESSHFGSEQFGNNSHSGKGLYGKQPLWNRKRPFPKQPFWGTDLLGMLLWESSYFGNGLFRRALMGNGPYGKRPFWEQQPLWETAILGSALMENGPNGKWPLWETALIGNGHLGTFLMGNGHFGSGHSGNGPYGKRPIWNTAVLGRAGNGRSRNSPYEMIPNGPLVN